MFFGNSYCGQTTTVYYYFYKIKVSNNVCILDRKYVVLNKSIAIKVILYENTQDDVTV